MTSEITQCPECGTRFKVSAAQLEAHEGMVRCGRCRVVFDARQHLLTNEPSPQLSLPIEPEMQLEELEVQTSTEHASVALDTLTAIDVAGEEPQDGVKVPDSATNPAAADTADVLETDISAEPIEHFLAPVADLAEPEQEQGTLAQRVRFIEDSPTQDLAPLTRSRRWAPVLVAVLLALALPAQALYFYRVELAAKLPRLRPLLSQYCVLLHCTVELPRQAELMSIESSELESGQEQSNIITLHALLHNHAAYAQAYPSLELTLTSLQDQPVARRIFRPADYLSAGSEAAKGLAANQEFDIALRLDTTDLKPSGYRLLLFYPK